MSTLSQKKCPCVANEFRHQGNEFCKSVDYESAEECYNQSLNFAEGESLALVYAQKASLSFKCQKFDECLENIDLARQSKMAEKKDLKCDCLSIMESNLNQLKFLQLSYPANEKLPFIVDCIDLITNDKYGRHVITRKDLEVGDIVAIEKPYCISPREDDSCATCNTVKSFDSLPCTYCVKTVFCSEACKEEATKAFHGDKLEPTNNVDGINCGSISRMARSMFSNALDLFGNSIEDLQDFLSANETHPKTIFDFDFSDPDETKNDKNRLLAVFTLIEGVSFSGTSVDEVAKFFFELAWKIANEYTSIPFASENDIGLYLFGSLLNHSCTPNVLAMEFEEKNIFFVIRPISKGQQLFISYGPSYLDEKKEDRQEQLNDSYDFHCDCEACEGNYQTLDEIKEANSVLTTIELPSWPKLNCSSTVELAIERYNHYCDLLRSTPELNNLDKILVTKYITCCIMKITAYEPKML